MNPRTAGISIRPMHKADDLRYRTSARPLTLPQRLTGDIRKQQHSIKTANAHTVIVGERGNKTKED
ncbi:hypothetical protein TYRP_000939 [Tyrophagus putrescentiae]|nr:hypothetical protein TYRP_000939 [Tyrophagus putrescentiae]